MKIYKGTFEKSNGELRTMTFVRIKDLPQGFLNEQIKGTGKQRELSGDKELVWDCERHGFRIFNWKTLKGEIKIMNGNFTNFTF